MELVSDGVRNLMKIDATLKDIDNKAEKITVSLEEAKNQLKTAKEEVEKPFPKMEELKSMEKRLNELNRELSLDTNSS